MPKEKASLLKMLLGDEPGPVARVLHTLSGDDEGLWGEKCIVAFLKNRLSTGTIFQNVYIPSSSGTAELDIVVLSQSGIYIFESKAYGGKIYGHPENMKWTQYLGGTKHTFYNPVKQNETHRRCLAQALQIPQETIFSFVVFENRADISEVFPLSGDHFVVCSRNTLGGVLQHYTLPRSPVFSESEVAALREKLEAWCHVSDEQKAAHIQQIRERMFGDACPVCGKKLVERKGRYGTFIGCSGYPRCTYTRDIT